MTNKKPLFDFKPWRYDRFDSPISECGSQIKDVYSAKRDNVGNLVVDKVGEENVYDYIQSFAQSVDLDLIMQRYENGETDALNKVQGFFGDFSSVPDNWPAVLNLINQGKVNFERMPSDFKEKYGNDFERFVCTFDLRDFVPLVDSDIPETSAPVESEVVKDES